jgi:hypothetical protein
MSTRDTYWDGWEQLSWQEAKAKADAREAALLASGVWVRTKAGRCVPAQYDWKGVAGKVLARDRQCVRCGDTVDLTIDHIIPRIRGGKNVLENLQILCRTCNSRKGSKIGAW